MMIELTILTHLAETLEAPVSLEKPDPAPARFVLFEKTGSSKSNRLSSSTFAFQSWAPTLYEAAQLNELVKAAVESLEELDEIGRVELSTDYNFTDTATKQYRYQAVYNISHY